MRNVKLDAVQVLRLWAALLVVFDHSVADLVAAGALPVDLKFAFRSGGFGVHIFFVISGFVMAHSMYERFAQPGAPRDFIRRRLIRIVPIYWLVTLLIWIKGIVSRGAVDVPSLLLSFGFIPYRSGGGQVQPINGVGWTLNFEMLFYMLFVLALFFPRRAGFAALSLALAALVGLGGFLTSLAPPGGVHTAIEFWTDSIMLYFLAGVWLGVARALLERKARVWEVTMPQAIGVALAVIVVFEYLLYRQLMTPWLEATLSIGLVALMGLVNADARRAPEKFLKLLGDASYSTYLIHLFVVSAIMRFIHPQGIVASIALVAMALVAAALAGLAVYYVIEKPMLRYFNRKFAPSRVTAAAAPA